MSVDCVVICCNSPHHADQVLLVLKDRPAWQKGKLNLPGGKIEDGETPLKAAIRELKEETGYVPLVTPREMGKIQSGQTTIHCFKAVVNSSVPPQAREGETELVEWHNWFRLLSDDRLIPNLKIIIPLIRSSVTDWVIGDPYRSEGKPRHTLKISVKK